MHEVNTCFTYCNTENIYHVRKIHYVEESFLQLPQWCRERILSSVGRLEPRPACYQEIVQLAERLDIPQTSCRSCKQYLKPACHPVLEGIWKNKNIHQAKLMRAGLIRTLQNELSNLWNTIRCSYLITLLNSWDSCTSSWNLCGLHAQVRDQVPQHPLKGQQLRFLHCAATNKKEILQR